MSLNGINLSHTSGQCFAMMSHFMIIILWSITFVLKCNAIDSLCCLLIVMVVEKFHWFITCGWACSLPSHKEVMSLLLCWVGTGLYFAGNSYVVGVLVYTFAVGALGSRSFRYEAMHKQWGWIVTDSFCVHKLAIIHVHLTTIVGTVEANTCERIMLAWYKILMTRIVIKHRTVLGHWALHVSES